MTALALSSFSRCDPLAGFIRSAALLSGSAEERIDGLCTRMDIPRDPVDWRSTLNNDGSPIQICLGCRPGKAGPNVRLIADPHRVGPDAASRRRQSQDALARLAGRLAPDMADLCTSVLRHMAPSGCGIPYLRDGGDAWLAAGIEGRGVAIYATARWGDPASRWARALAWLADLSPAATQAAATLAKLAEHSILISVGVEGSCADDARAKFYWRPKGSAPLSGLGVALLTHEAFPAFLSDATEGMATAVTAIVGSVGVSVATGALADVKLDLCGHCVPRSRIDWAQRIERLASRHGLTAPPFMALEPDAPIEIAFVGLGIDRDLRPRLNIYLKPIVRGGHR
ncbi:MAG TPA: hypothetical protein VF409_12415 [Sphingomonas sp.]